MQTTIANEVTVAGCALHSGREVQITLRPAKANAGIRFRRTDVTDRANVVMAQYDAVVNGDFRTVIQNQAGVRVETVEHLMAALAALGVDNLAVDVDGPELPILDGSALEYAELIEKAGLAELHEARYALHVRKQVEVVEGEARATIEPSDKFELAFGIEFPDPAIGVQSLDLAVINGAAMHELLPARTFVMLNSVAALRARGLANGGSLDNAIVVDDGRVLNQGGLRYEDEFVRHKMLDALGDLYLCGYPIVGRYSGFRSGHRLTNQLLVKLMHDDSAWKLEEVVARKISATSPRSEGASELHATA